jgi:hypothetical protein
VEIRWLRMTHKHYYHKPAILEDLSQQYLLDFFEIDTNAQEDKLVVFLEKVCALHTEAKHQQVLKHYGLSYLWSVKSRISMFLMLEAVALNLMLLMYYKRDYYHRILISADVSEAFNVLMIMQIAGCFIMATLYITVRLPSRYKSNLQNGKSIWEAGIGAISDPMPVWYIFQFFVAILAFTLDKVFCCIFLLEFVVLDSTTQYLLKAVQHPFRQLVATLIILVVAIHIFSGLYFELFSYDMEHNHVTPIYDLWSSLRLALTYGLRGEYGVDHEFYVTIGPRMWLDLAFYFIILAILRHIFFAIIVETFGQLRELKNERDEKLHNSCFICGVERHDFEKAGFSVSFQHHRFISHHIQNYIHFIFCVLEQDPKEDQGVESFVRKCIVNRDISWIPVGLDKMYKPTKRDGFDEASAGIPAHHAEALAAASKLPRHDHEDDIGGDNDESKRSIAHYNAAGHNNEHKEDGNIEGNTEKAAVKDLIDLVQNLHQSVNTINSRIDTMEINTSAQAAVLTSQSTPVAATPSSMRSANRAPMSSKAISGHQGQLRGPFMQQLKSTSRGRDRTVSGDGGPDPGNRSPSPQSTLRRLIADEETKDL